jgi:hypothetical protein
MSRSSKHFFITIHLLVDASIVSFQNISQLLVNAVVQVKSSCQSHREDVLFRVRIRTPVNEHAGWWMQPEKRDHPRLDWPRGLSLSGIRGPFSRT